MTKSCRRSSSESAICVGESDKPSVCRASFHFAVHLALNAFARPTVASSNCSGSEAAVDKTVCNRKTAAQLYDARLGRTPGCGASCVTKDVVGRHRCAHKDTAARERAARACALRRRESMRLNATDAVNQLVETVPEVETKALPGAPGRRATLARKRSSSPRQNVLHSSCVQSIAVLCLFQTVIVASSVNAVADAAPERASGRTTVREREGWCSSRRRVDDTLPPPPQPPATTTIFPH